jgi:hypothetical protein
MDNAVVASRHHLPYWQSSDSDKKNAECRERIFEERDSKKQFL